jgi:hypothetical protein
MIKKGQRAERAKRERRAQNQALNPRFGLTVSRGLAQARSPAGQLFATQPGLVGLRHQFFLESHETGSSVDALPLPSRQS